jgi:hypothetical protein
MSVLQAQGTRKQSGSEQDWLGIIIQDSKTGHPRTGIIFPRIKIDHRYILLLIDA